MDYIESVEKCVYEDANRVAKIAMEAYKNGEVERLNPILMTKVLLNIVKFQVEYKTITHETRRFRH